MCQHHRADLTVAATCPREHWSAFGPGRHHPSRRWTRRDTAGPSRHRCRAHSRSRRALGDDRPPGGGDSPAKRVFLEAYGDRHQDRRWIVVGDLQDDIRSVFEAGIVGPMHPWSRMEEGAAGRIAAAHRVATVCVLRAIDSAAWHARQVPSSVWNRNPEGGRLCATWPSSAQIIPGLKSAEVPPIYSTSVSGVAESIRFLSSANKRMAVLREEGR